MEKKQFCPWAMELLTQRRNTTDQISSVTGYVRSVGGSREAKAVREFGSRVPITLLTPYFSETDTHTEMF